MLRRMRPGADGPHRHPGSCGRRPLVAICLGLLPALSAPGQQPPSRPELPERIPHDEVRARRDRDLPLWETLWEVDPAGALRQWPNPAAGGSTDQGMAIFEAHPTGPGTDPHREVLVRRVARDPGHFLAALLRQPGDLLGATLATRHFEQLGRDTSEVALRQFLVTPDLDLTPVQQRRSLLDRQLAVRLLQQRAVRTAMPELEVLARKATDPWLRWTAQDALATFSPDTKAARRVALLQQPLPPPATADLWLWFDFARWPARDDVAEARRAALTERLYDMILAAGGSCPPAALAGAQYLVDLPDELPCEVARVWGRARVDQCLLGLARGDGGMTLGWAAASGAFEVDVLREHLARHGVAFERAGDGLVSDRWWPGLAIEVHPAWLHVARVPTAPAAGAWPPPFAPALVAEAAPFAIHLPAGSALPPPAALLLPSPGTVTLRFQPFSAIARLAAIDDGPARAAAALERAMELVGDPPPAVRAAWSKAMADARVDQLREGGGTRLRVEGTGLDPFDLWPLLRLLHR